MQKLTYSSRKNQIISQLAAQYNTERTRFGKTSTKGRASSGQDTSNEQLITELDMVQ